LSLSTGEKQIENYFFLGTFTRIVLNKLCFFSLSLLKEEYNYFEDTFYTNILELINIHISVDAHPSSNHICLGV